jgi:hypothetical protein
VGGVGGQASGHQGIVVELEDGAATPDEDPRRSVTRSSLVAATLTALEGSLWTAATCGKEEVSSGLEHLAARTASHRRG